MTHTKRTPPDDPDMFLRVHMRFLLADHIRTFLIGVITGAFIVLLAHDYVCQPTDQGGSNNEPVSKKIV